MEIGLNGSGIDQSSQTAALHPVIPAFIYLFVYLYHNNDSLSVMQKAIIYAMRHSVMHCRVDYHRMKRKSKPKTTADGNCPSLGKGFP